MSHASSVQMELIQGKCEDTYYANPETTKKACIPTKQTTKYTQAFNSLNGGVSTFTIPPNFGLQGVCVTLTLPAIASGAGTGVAVSRGWGYSLVKQISYRVGGSTQFFVSSAQMLQHALKRMTNQQAKDDLYTLGGSYASGATLETAQTAYVFIDLPFNKATSEGMPVPLASDCLGAQVQITVELNPLSSIVALNASASLPTAYSTGLSAGTFQVQQLLMASRDDSLAVRENLATHQYVNPVEFVQQEQSVTNIANTTSVQTITATGFRSGSVKSIEMWLTRNADNTTAVRNINKWYIPQNIQCTYAGDVYARFDNGISQLWNLINSKTSPYVNGLTTTYSSGYVNTAEQYGWATLPFAQTYDVADTGDFMLVEGLQVTNGIVTIAFSTPSAQSDWVLHLSYIYNASIVFSQSSAEFVF